MQIIFIALLVITSCIGQNLNEVELRQRLADYGIEKDWSKSKEVAYLLLKEFKDSNERETYFNVLALSISNESFSIRMKNKLPPDTAQQKGTITLYLSEKLNNEIKGMYNELIVVADSYLKEYSDGQFEDSFFTYLISSYAILGQHEKVQEICKKLYNSNKSNLKLKAAFHLGRFAHFQKKYQTAIEYYNFILDKLGKSENRVLYNYLIANCYFELKDIENTYKYLNNVFELTENDKKNDVRKMAEIMDNHLKTNIEKFNRKFVVFRDPANDS